MNAAVGPVRLEVPASQVWAPLVRLAASGVAHVAGFSMAEIEELRVAVDELFALLVGDDVSEEPIELRFVVDGESVGMQAARRSTPEPPAVSSVVAGLLDATTDQWDLQWDLSEAGGQRLVTLSKRRSQSPPPG